MNVAGLRVLVVDDDRFARETIGAMLDTLGAQTLFADGGAAALAQVREHAPDVVLMNIVMPGMSGFEAAARIRAETPRRTPVIFVSASDDDESLCEAEYVSGDGFLVKPFDLARLLGTVRELVGEA